MQHLCQHSIELYKQIRASRKPADYQIAAYFKQGLIFTDKEKKFISEAVYNGLKSSFYFEAILKRLAFSDIDIPALILFLSLQKSFDEKLLVGRFANLLKKPEAFFYQLLNSYKEYKELLFITDPLERLATLYSIPVWISQELAKNFSMEELEDLFDSLNKPAPLCLRVNSYKISLERLKDMLAEEGITSTASNLSPFALIATAETNIFKTRAFQQGFFEVQDEGSQIVSLLLNPKPNAVVLDACAGSGGKSLHVSALMKGRGEVFAFDTDSWRLAKIGRRIARAGVQNIRVIKTKDQMEEFKKRYHNKLDRVLIDAPCSGIGTIRRSPDIKLKLSKELVAQMVAKQQTILRDYCHLVKPGGLIVYATCSLFDDENQSVVEEFLATQKGFTLKPVGEVFGEMKVDFDISNLAKEFEMATYLRMLPNIHKSDGFFAAVIRKSTVSS